MVPLDSVAGNTLIGMFTRLTLRKPFHVARAAIMCPFSHFHVSAHCRNVRTPTACATKVAPYLPFALALCPSPFALRPLPFVLCPFALCPLPDSEVSLHVVAFVVRAQLQAG